MRRLANAVRTALPATLLAFLAQPLQAQERTLDGFEDVAAWEAAPSDGVSLAISTGEGRAARAMRLDFDFHGGAGYAVARRALPLDLPENYRFTFWIRADAPVNNLEFKLVDSSGDNVWWVNRRGFEFPGEWRKITIARRHLEFAWGPAGG
nr:coagulation factor 5/8 type domain-containing protein [Gemmatimonadota bacterium]